MIQRVLLVMLVLAITSTAWSDEIRPGVMRTPESWNKAFLVAFTDQDPLTGVGRDMFVERVPGAQNVPILGAGHFVQEDAGTELAELMVDFMQGRPLPEEIVIQ